jgi:glycosyltransferase involved in cell wall biosynthesis
MKKLLLLTIGGFSHVNDQITAQFEQKGVECVRVDLLRYIEKRNFTKHPYTIVRSLLTAYLENRNSYLNSYKKTAFAFRQLTKVATELVREIDCDVILQTQLLFTIDRKVIDKPYFVYTDFTHHLFNSDIQAGFSTSAISRVSDEAIDLERLAYQSADKVFVYTPYMAEDLVEFYNVSRDKVSSIGMGINVALPPPVQDWSHSFRILFIGIDYERKGGALAVEAFQLVRERHPNATLTIVGSSPNIELPGVKILGKISLEDVEKELVRADVFLMPSFQEPSGVAFLEAIAYGLVVVAVRLNSLVGHLHENTTCLFANSHDAGEIATQINTAFEKPDASLGLVKKGYEQVRSMYLWSMVVDKLLEEMRSQVSLPSI